VPSRTCFQPVHEAEELRHDTVLDFTVDLEEDMISRRATKERKMHRTFSRLAVTSELGTFLDPESGGVGNTRFEFKLKFIQTINTAQHSRLRVPTKKVRTFSSNSLKDPAPLRVHGMEPTSGLRVYPHPVVL
jgi:hypothetical protein